VEAILTRYRVQGLLTVRYTERVRSTRCGAMAADPRRAGGTRPRGEGRRRSPGSGHRDWRLGWRVYATNAPAEQLSLAQAVLAYRSQYLVESDMGRLKGHPLSLTPMYLQRDDHVTGLIRLLSVACGS